MKLGAVLVLAIVATGSAPLARAGGSNYGITPGVLPSVAGKVSEWPVPTPKFARDPAIGPYGLALDRDGNVWFCRMGADRMGRLDPRTGRMSELDTGRGSQPRRVAAAPDGMLWVTYYGNGKLAKIDPAAMKVVGTYQLPG